MLEDIIFPEFDHIEKTLTHNNPSEIHGMLCGMLCVNDILASDTWINQILSETAEINLLAEAVLKDLFNATVSQFDDDNMSFSLLLPDDDVTLHIRAESLGYWCQGYLSGLGLAYQDEDTEVPDEVHEFLADVSNIAKVGFFDTDEAKEEDEIAYMELVEYVRIGVMLVNYSLRPKPDLAPSPQLH